MEFKWILRRRKEKTPFNWDWRALDDWNDKRQKLEIKLKKNNPAQHLFSWVYWNCTPYICSCLRLCEKGKRMEKTGIRCLLNGICYLTFSIFLVIEYVHILQHTIHNNDTHYNNTLWRFDGLYRRVHTAHSTFTIIACKEYTYVQFWP